MAAIMTSERAHARWSDLAALGFAMIATGMILGFVAIFVFGSSFSDQGPFLILFGVVALIAAGLVRRFGTWAKIVGAVLGLAAAGGLSFEVGGIVRPNSFLDFMFAVLLPAGGVFALVGSIAAIVAGRRGHVGTKAAGAEARTIRIVVAAIGVLAVFSLATTFATHTTASKALASREVDMKNTKFTSRDVSIGGGSNVYVHNSDPYAHTFTVDALGIDVTVNPGSSKLIAIPARSGTYVLYCRFHTGNKAHPSSSDMAATLNVS